MTETSKSFTEISSIICVPLFLDCLSQNYSMVEVGSGLWKSSGLNSLLKQGHLQLIAQDHIQTEFEYLQKWRMHKLSGHPMLVVDHPHSIKGFSAGADIISSVSVCVHFLSFFHWDSFYRSHYTQKLYVHLFIISPYTILLVFARTELIFSP